MKKTRTCLVGVSGFGANHYETLLQEQTAGHLTIVAATVVNQDEELEKCARLGKQGCRIFDNTTAMFADMRGRADLCVLPVGIALHRPMVEAALQAGMHVIVEKPAAGAIQDVRAMQAQACRNRRIVAVAYQDLYSAEILQLKQRLLDARLGSIRHIRVWGLWPRTHAYYARNKWAGTRRTDEGWVLDSPANNACAHELMMALFLAGSELHAAGVPEQIEAELYRTPHVDNADTLCMRIIMDNHVPVLGIFSHATPKNGGAGVCITCTRGTVNWTRNTAIIEIDGQATESIAFPHADDLRRNIISAVRHVDNGDPAFYCSLEMASMQTLVVNGANEASCLHDLPPDCLERITHNQEEQTAVKGLDRVCKQALNQNKLFSELHVPWSQPAGRFDLRGYQDFKGGKATHTVRCATSL